MEVYVINPIESKGLNMKKEYIKPFAWGMGVGAVVLLIVIFSAGWVVTSNSAKAEAKVMATEAVMNRLGREQQKCLCGKTGMGDNAR